MNNNQVEVFVMCEKIDGALSQLKIRDIYNGGKEYAVVSSGDFRSVVVPKNVAIAFFVLGFCEVRRRFGRSCVCRVSGKRIDVGIGQLIVERVCYLEN